MAATDAAAIFAVLRGSTLRRRLARTLEGESGINDPVAVLLVLGFIEWIQQPDYGLGDMAWLSLRELAIGFVSGLAVGAAAVGSSGGTCADRRPVPGGVGRDRRARVRGAAILDGSGFLAVYLAGLVLGGARIPAKRTIVAFHDGLAWVAQIGLFLMLGLLVFPNQLDDVRRGNLRRPSSSRWSRGRLRRCSRPRSTASPLASG